MNLRRILSLLMTLAVWPCASTLFACDVCRYQGLSNNCAHAIAEYVHGLQAGTAGELSSDEVAAFNTFGNGWTSTSQGTSTLGQPAKVTWSVVPDGTILPRGLANATNGEESNDPSGLIAFLDGVHHGGDSPGGSDLTQRSWWQLINSSFERWDAVSGISFDYEENDDGRQLGVFSGATGVRGDHRLGGHSIDGQISPTFLAYNFFANNSDMVIDTDEINRWSNSANNYRLFRNMLMHEIGHGIGLNHVEPTTQTKLMEPRISTAYDGPQFDDILGVHRLYGDNNEEDGGNDTYVSATMLGVLAEGETFSVGTDAVDAVVTPDEVDFISIDDNSDVDYFKFSVNAAQLVDIKITPMGPTYDEGTTAANAVPFDASAQSNLTLTLFDSDGTTQLEFQNATGLGGVEMIDDFQLDTGGDYFVRVAGLSNAAQFFRLDVIAVPEPASWLLTAVAVSVFATRRRSALSRGY
ncbi:MAG: matrixin family metalloprotease [Planctomycetota bacterium]